MNRYEFAALARASVPDSPKKRRAEADLARRILAALRAEIARRMVEDARCAAAALAADEYEAQRPGAFKPDGQRPRCRRRAVILAVGTDDVQVSVHAMRPPPPDVFDVGDDR